MFGLNHVDLIIILGTALNTLFQVRLGFFVLTRKLIAFIGSAILAFLVYDIGAEPLMVYFDFSKGLADALSFVILFFLFQTGIDLVLNRLFLFIPEQIRTGKWSKVFAIIPGAIDSLILAALILFVLAIVPAFPQAKEDISDSYLGNPLVDTVSGIEYYLIEVFGEFGQESLTFLTVLPESDETIEISYRPANLSVDEEAEQEMLKLLNAERIKKGIRPLEWDDSITPVARAHSRDMWERGYFSHTSPDGEDPFDRMSKAGINYTSAGENLAMARTTQQAHQGLMNSPGHRANILREEFTRVGIGVIDGGIYGKMYTQNFAR